MLSHAQVIHSFSQKSDFRKSTGNMIEKIWGKILLCEELERKDKTVT